VNDIHKHVTDRQRYGKFLSALSDECLLFCFSGFNFATNELPKESSRLVRWALADQKLIIIPY
jgi:hypothetical protein